MKGRVKTFNNDKGYGFITSEYNNDYFFHISEVKSLEKIERGNSVSFTAGVNDKGLVAKNIEIAKAKSFIAFDNVRLKLSNIKNYGLYTWQEKYEYEFTKEEMKRREMEMKESEGKVVRGIKNTITVVSIISTLLTDSDYGCMFRGAEPTETRYRTRKKLYVTTYQNDNYEFYDDEVGFNLDLKLKELDEQLA